MTLYKLEQLVPVPVKPVASTIEASLPAFWLEALPQHDAEHLLRDLAALAKATHDRCENFTQYAPERSQALAEAVAAANHLYAQTVTPRLPQAPVEIGPGWREAGNAAGQLLGLAVRGLCEIGIGAFGGFFRGVFAAKTNIESIHLPEIPANVAPIPSNNVHVRVQVDVDVKI